MRKFCKNPASGLSLFEQKLNPELPEPRFCRFLQVAPVQVDQREPQCSDRSPRP